MTSLKYDIQWNLYKQYPFLSCGFDFYDDIIYGGRANDIFNCYDDFEYDWCDDNSAG